MVLSFKNVQRLDASAAFQAIWHIKKRLFGPGGVANPRDTTRYRCGLRLARTKNPSFFICASKRETLPQESVGLSFRERNLLKI